MRSSFRFWGLLFSFSFNLVSFLPHPTEAAPNRTFSFRIRGEPETLDWNRAHTLIEAYLLMNLMEGLVTFDSTFKISPALAESWTLSADRKTYTFKLRPGVKWSDGVPLKAQDFVYSWRRLLSPLTAASYSYLLFDIEGAESFSEGRLTDFDQVGIKALNDDTLQVKLAHPVAHWITIPAFWVTFPMRKDIVEKYGNTWEAPGRMVNLGPFSLVGNEFGSKVTLKSNPKYYGAHGNLEQVVAYVIKDDAEALAQFNQGKLDFLTDLSMVDIQRLRSKPEFKSFAHLKTGFIEFVTDKFPLSNLKLRRAIAMAIDKSELARLGVFEPATSFIPPMMMGHSMSIGLPFNPVLARAELKKSGLDTSVPLKLDYLLPNWDKSQAVAKFLQVQLKKNLALEIVPHPVDNKAYRNLMDLQSYPMFEMTWTADYPDPDNFLSLFLGSSGNSHTTWKDDDFDKIVQEARKMDQGPKREKAYVFLQQFLQETEVVLVPLYYEPNLALVSSRVKKFELNPLDYLYLRKVDVIP